MFEYTFAGVLLIILVALIAYVFWTTHDRLIALDERCSNTFADIDVQLRHRHRLIPSLVEAVKGFAAHEANVLTEVIQARASAMGANGVAKLEAETQLGQSINSLMAVAEKYPDITASSHFRDLRIELVDCENRITASRRFYNLAVDEFNATMRQFPGNRIASMFQLGRRNYFEASGPVPSDDPIAIAF